MAVRGQRTSLPEQKLLKNSKTGTLISKLVLMIRSDVYSYLIHIIKIDIKFHTKSSLT